MKRFILKEEPDGGVVRLCGLDYHYLVRVRRLARGEFFPALLPGGGEVLVRVTSVSGGVLTGEAAPEGEACGGGDVGLPPVFLLQAMPKDSKMDLIVRQAAEGGLSGVVPFFSEFSIVKSKDASKKNSRRERWDRIVKEARQQSGSKIPTKVWEPLSMEGLFSFWEDLKSGFAGSLGLLFHHLPLGKTKSLHYHLEKGPGAVAALVGPEGGFSEGEAARFLEAGFEPAAIAGAVLRVETASLYAQAAVKIILLEKDSWTLK